MESRPFQQIDYRPPDSLTTVKTENAWKSIPKISSVITSSRGKYNHMKDMMLDLANFKPHKHIDRTIPLSLILQSRFC